MLHKRYRKGLFKMNENNDTDFVEDALDNIFVSPCENCDFDAECSFWDSSKYCEKKYYKKLQAERIA